MNDLIHGVLHEDQPAALHEGSATESKAPHSPSGRRHSKGGVPGLGLEKSNFGRSVDSIGSPGRGRSPGKGSTSPGRFKQSFSPGRNGKGGGRVSGGSVHSTGDRDDHDHLGPEEVRQMKAEMSELKAQIKVDQQLIAGISSNEMVQYIIQLEAQNAELHRRAAESSATLRTSKVANLVLTQREEKKVGMGTGLGVGAGTTAGMR